MKMKVTTALFIIGSAIITPLVLIFIINELFGAGISYTFLNWLLSSLLILIFNPDCKTK